jgi:hypothetical protein
LPTCSKSSTSISLDLTTCQETTAFTDAPAVTSCDVSVTSLDGTVKLDVSAAPGGTFDFSSTVPDTQQVTVTVNCTTSDGTQVMGGSSLGGLLLSSIGSDVPVFLQRTEQWARPCGSLSCSHLGGVAFSVEGRYVNLVGGTKSSDPACDPTAIDAYDLFGLTGDNPVPALIPGDVRTAVPLGAQTLFFSTSGAARYDWSTGAQPGPEVFGANVSFTAADVLGGAVVPACLPTSAGGCAGGARYFVVGATRRSGSTTAVLEVDVDLMSNVTYGGYTLNTPRQGAAATWIQGAGLVVAGGSEAGQGVEVLDETTGKFKTLGYPPDPVEGAGAVTNGSNAVLLVGGLNGKDAAPTRTIDLGCAAPCSATVLPAAALPTTLQYVSVFQLSAGRELVIGDEVGPMGMTHSYVIDLGKGTVTEPMLREPRRGATPVGAPNGTLALLGGQHADATPALSIELFLP